MNAVELELTSMRASGWIAAVFLILAVAPLGRWKRRFGLASFAAAALHLGIGFATPLIPSMELLWYEPHLRSGATALLVLSFLAATSFSSVVRTLGLRHWKVLHRAVYLALLLVLHHALLSPHLPRAGAIALGFAVLLAIARRVLLR
jgi:DMSO/TMAO reductase YedYZ heme-binding membrane subunit